MNAGEKGFRVIVGRLEIRASRFNKAGIEWVGKSAAQGFAVYSRAGNGALLLQGMHLAFDDAFSYCMMAFEPGATLGFNQGSPAVRHCVARATMTPAFRMAPYRRGPNARLQRKEIARQKADIMHARDRIYSVPGLRKITRLSRYLNRKG